MSEMIRKHPTLGIEVSSYGRVNIPATKNSKEHWTLGCINKKGYSVVMLRKKLYYVHRLIAQTFIKNENNFPLVDHIDRNKRNNHVENLRWATSKMNIDNQEKVDNALKKYGVRRCDDSKAYYKAYGIYKRRGKKMKNELNWNKYKRCLAMALLWLERTENSTDLENELVSRKRCSKWMELADKFKEAK